VPSPPTESPVRTHRRGRQERKAAKAQAAEDKRIAKAALKAGKAAEKRAVKQAIQAQRDGRPGQVVPAGSGNVSRRQRRKRAKAMRLRRRRAGVLTGVMLLAVLIAAVTAVGVVAAVTNRPVDTRLVSPLLAYPVSQTTPGQCLAGTQGVTGNLASGPVCYQVTAGIAIHRVHEITVRHDAATGYAVQIRLFAGDRKAFADLTRRTVGRTLAFVVRTQVVTVSKVEMPITGGMLLIAGLTGRPDADRVVQTLTGHT
jgi:hypothetical protein